MIFGDESPGTGQLVDAGSDDSTKVQIKTRGGDGQVQLGNVDLMGSARDLIGPNVDVSGSIYVDGMLDKLAIGDVTGGSFVIVNADGETTKFTARHVSDVDMLVSVGGRFRFDTWTNTDHTAYLLMVTGRHAALSITAEETMDAVVTPPGDPTQSHLESNSLSVISREPSASGQLVLQHLDHAGMSVPQDKGAVIDEVEQVVAINIKEMDAFAAVCVQRKWVREYVGARVTPRERFPGSLEQGPGSRVALHVAGDGVCE